MKKLDYYWYNKSGISLLLLPLSWIFSAISLLRRYAYYFGVFKVYHFDVPIIIVGNITVGGTGKTPLVIWLVAILREQGYTPGIVSRGYGGQASSWPQQVRADSDPRMVGDEAVLLVQRCGCPMAVGPSRVDAVAALLKHTQCDIIVVDDGLQHYALGRDVEIAVVDGVRRFGNGYRLPAGPLREPVKRLATVDFVVTNGVPGPREYRMDLVPGLLHNLSQSEKTASLDDFSGKTVHAVAGIGHPERFFHLLELHHINVIRHPFPDHFAFSKNDLRFDDDLPVLMTEKDAVKYKTYADSRFWCVSVNAEVDDRISPLLLRLVER